MLTQTTVKPERRVIQAPSRSSGRSTASAIGTLTAVVVTAFVFAALYFGREILIPLAMAGLIAFLLTPVVVHIERWIGRVAGVVVAVLVMMSVIVGVGWVLTGQIVDLVEKLPDYEGNIRAKLHALKVPQNGNFGRLSGMFSDLKQELPGGNDSSGTNSSSPDSSSRSPGHPSPAAGSPVVPVQVMEGSSPASVQSVKDIASAIMSPLGTTALVLLLSICMLLQRENLRSRLTRIVGGSNISGTKRAMDDAAGRVARYLQMQFAVNITYGILIATCLYFIGVPNVLVWGVLATVLRFIPYVGAWIAASFPIVLSLTVSNGWSMLLITVGMFVVIELLFGNLVEPWLYGAHTGVSAFALILAAVFWTWMWGAAGLVLATPLTVCLVVMARHVPALSMLGVLLSDEEPLPPYQEFYHRLLSPGEKDVGDFAESYIKANSQTAFYDSVFIPALVAIEEDQQGGELEGAQLAKLQEDLRDVITDIGTWPEPEPKEDASRQDETGTLTTVLVPTCRVLCLPARATRDEIAGSMLAQLLEIRHYPTQFLSAELTTRELIEAVVQDDSEVAFISVIAPTTIIQTRYLCGKLRAACPSLHIFVGLWGVNAGLSEAAQRLRASGASTVVTSLAEAAVQLARFASTLSHELTSQVPSADEMARLAEVEKLHLMDTLPEPRFDRITARLARILNAPVALISLMNTDRQFFKSQQGLPDSPAQSRTTPRELAICNQVVASNKSLVVEDLARDHRFSNNPLVRESKLRFYAGVPLRSRSGHAIGSLCVLDTKPRKFSDHENRLLEVTAEEVMDIINSRTAEQPATAATSE